MRIPLIDVEEIEDEGSYTAIVLTNGKVILVEEDVVVVVSTEFVIFESE